MFYNCVVTNPQRNLREKFFCCDLITSINYFVNLSAVIGQHKVHGLTHCYYRRYSNYCVRAWFVHDLI